MDALKPHLIAHKVGYPMSLANVDEVLLTVTISLFVEHEKLHQRLQQLKNKRIPTLVVYGERDKLVLKNSFNKLLEDLGVNQKDLNYFSADGTIEKTITNEDWIKVLIFRNGGHFAYAKYSDIVNNQINKLLSRC
jgi:pimeloyl-ACP methyl ester carboxylesterase